MTHPAVPEHAPVQRTDVSLIRDPRRSLVPPYVSYGTQLGAPSSCGAKGMHGGSVRIRIDGCASADTRAATRLPRC